MANPPQFPNKHYKGHSNHKGSRQSVCKSTIKGQFTTVEVYEVIRDKKTSNRCSTLIWCPSAQPKHRFIVWLANKDRLLTKKRISKWNSSIDVACSFCKSDDESHDHLFQDCPATRKIWKNCMSKCGITQIESNWLKIMDWMIDLVG